MIQKFKSISAQPIDRWILCGDKIDSKLVKGAIERCYWKSLKMVLQFFLSS